MISPTSVQAGARSIEIPTRDGSEVVEVFLDELPDEAEELCEILVAEEAPIELFHQFSLEYYKRAHKHAFIKLLKKGISEAKHRKNPCGAVTSKLFSTLAAHYISEGINCPVGERKLSVEYLEEATSCLNEAEKRNSASEDFGVRKGLLTLAKNSVEAAGYIFKFCLDKTPTSLPALLGQACVQFFSGKYRTALQAFQSILKINPQFNEIRSAIGYCFHRLGYNDMALKAFNRVLQVDPKNEAAMLAVGFLQLSQESQLQNGLVQMKKVYELNKSNAVAQIHLANHFFFKKDLVKAKTLAEGALTHAPSDKIKAEAFFILAKISHVSGNFAEALGNYQLSTKLAPDFLPALFGLGQCFLARGDLDGASMMFDRVLDGEPNCPEVIRLMALILSSKVASARSDEIQTRKELTEKALVMIKSALTFFPKDQHLLLCGAVLNETIDPFKSIELYTNAKCEESENFAVLNNFIVLKQSFSKIEGENFDADRKILKKAMKLAESQSETIRLFLKFNEARLIEECNETEAENLYREILKINPNFSLAHLRLGIICHQRGQFAEGADHFKDVLGIDEHNRDAWNCIAATHLKQKAFTPARKSFERVLQNIDKNDSYALVALGNIYIELARQDKSLKHTEEYHKRAGEFFGKALNIEKGNIYAAQGLGLIFADRGMTSESKEIFTQVRSAQSQNSAHNKVPLINLDTTLNLAHALTELGQYAGAAILYSSVIDSVKSKESSVDKIKANDSFVVSSGKTVSLLLFLCRSRYLLAGECADYQSADLAIKDARLALEILPRDQPLKFNLGLLLQSRAKAINATTETPEATEISDLLNSARSNVEEALEIFKEIISESSISSSSSSKMDHKLVNSRISLCSDLFKNIHERSELNQKSIKEQYNRMEQLKIQRAHQQECEMALKIQKEALERQKLTEIETSRRELALKMRETEEKVKASAFRAPNKSTKDEHENNSSESESEIDDNSGSNLNKKRVKTSRASNSNFESKSNFAALTGSEDSAGDEDELDGITGKGRRRTSKVKGKISTTPLLSKEFISSEEEDLDEKAPLYNDKKEMDIDQF